jgi:hypothetical protein
MITVAIRIVENSLAAWLGGVGTLLTIRELDLPATLAGNRELLATCERNGLRIANLDRLLPAAFSVHLAEIEEPRREALLTQVRTAAVACLPVAPRRLSLEFAFRYATQPPPAGPAAHTAWLTLVRRLLPLTTDPPGLVLCLPVPLPPTFQGSKELAAAGNLLYEIMHPACRLALDVFPGELPGDFDSFHFLRDCLFHLEMVRFHYAPSLGETLDETVLGKWAEALHHQGFKGVVVFAPQASTDDGVRAACSNADRLAHIFLA